MLTPENEMTMRQVMSSRSPQGIIHFVLDGRPNVELWPAAPILDPREANGSDVEQDCLRNKLIWL